MDDNKQNAEPAGTAVSTAEDNSQNYYENKNYDNYDTFDYMEEAKRINTREEPSTAAWGCSARPSTSSASAIWTRAPRPGRTGKSVPTPSPSARRTPAAAWW